MIHSSKGVRGTVLCLLLSLSVELTAGPQPPQISKAQRRSTVAGVIMMRVVGCQMQDEAWALGPCWWINPRKLQLIVGSVQFTQDPHHYISQLMAVMSLCAFPE